MVYVSLKLSIVIVNHNTGHLLEKCLLAIKESVLRNKYEAIVIDNASTDSSQTSVEEKYPFVTLIQNEHNLGYARAYNQGTKLAKGRYILHLNPDTQPQPNSIEAMVFFMDAHPEAGIVGAKVVKPDGRLDLPCKRGFPTPLNSLFQAIGLTRLFPRSKVFAHYYLGHLDPDQTHEIDAVSGAVLMIRRETIDEVGMLDERFFIYGEDLDWCYRVKEKGWKVYYYPRAAVVHYHGASSEKQSFRMIGLFHKSMMLYYQKHFAPKRFALVNWLVYGGIGLRYIKCMLVNVFKKQKSVV